MNGTVLHKEHKERNGTGWTSSRLRTPKTEQNGMWMERLEKNERGRNNLALVLERNGKIKKVGTCPVQPWIAPRLPRPVQQLHWLTYSRGQTCGLARQTGLAGPTGLTRSDFRLHLV